MATYTLLQSKFWTTKDVPTPQGEKQFAYYFLTLEGVEPDKAIDALWKTSPSTPELTAGQIEGTVEKTDRGWKFTKGKGELRKPDFEVVASHAKPNTGPDARDREIVRQHSQHMALLEAAIESRDPEFDWERFRDHTAMKDRIQWWDDDVFGRRED